MKTIEAFGLVALLLGGCVGVQPYPYASDAFSQQAPTQYAPPQQYQPVGCMPPYYPVWNGCALPSPPVVYVPMYPGYYGYGRPITEFGIRFGKHGRNFIHGLW